MSNKKLLKATVSYDGSEYYGWQKQPNQKSVQSEIEKALTIVCNEDIVIHGSGRTDKGAHARGQVFHFETTTNLPVQAIKIMIRGELDKSIYITELEEVQNSFHARFDVKKKQYRYFVTTGGFVPTERNYRWNLSDKPFDTQKIVECAKLFIGEHDFTAFGGGTLEEKDKNRTIYNLSLEQLDQRTWCFIVTGNGFLKYMVRNIVKTLVLVGQGKLTINDAKKILDSKDRAKTPPPAPSGGLVLWKVEY